MKFWDASAIIPLCLEEPWSSHLKRVVQQDATMVVWWATPIECCSALARLRRDGILRPAGEEQAHDILYRLSMAWVEIQPGQEVRRQAERALRLHSLRAADALQLAAALVWVQGRPAGLHMVCLDHRLRAAAYREGFQVLPAMDDVFR